MEYVVYSDGAARGNPGPAGAGFVIFDEKGTEIFKKSISLGSTTNNVAEYTALLEGAKYIMELNPDKVTFFLDSELIVKQISGEYKVKAEHLKSLYIDVMKIFKKINYACNHIPRAKNKIADGLANIGADGSEKQ